MSVLNKILGRNNKGPVAVPTPEWPDLDGRLSVRRMSPAERTEFYELVDSEKANKNPAFRACLACHCAVLADGTPAFAAGDWRQLLDDPGSGSALDRLGETADGINTMSDWAKEQLKKKYEPTPPSASTSASPAKAESA